MKDWKIRGALGIKLLSEYLVINRISDYFVFQSTLNIFILLSTPAMKNTRLTFILGTILVLLLIPLVAMQFSDEVDWDLFDFTIMGILLLITGLSIEFVLRSFRRIQERVLISGAILFVFFLVWAELAVGIFGSPWAGSWSKSP